MTPQNYIPLIELTRGEAVESTHFGAFVIVDNQGKIISSQGNPELVTFQRSSAKPFQTIPFVENGGHKKLGFTLREVAIMCASHSGTDNHFSVLQSMQEKIQLGQEHLLCGTHAPVDTATREAMVERNEEPTPNRHNCSGKHTGMMAYAKWMDAPIEDYINPEHPIQKQILQTFCEMCDVEPKTVKMGIDGCSAPVFAIPMKNAAYGYACLCDPENLAKERREACRTITKAMTTNPDMIAGPGKFDTRLMEVAKGKIVSKGGAEGYQQVGIMPNVINPGSPGLGLALKISDGDPTGRARAAVTLEILHQLGAVTTDELEKLSEFGPKFSVKNWRKIIVGEAYPIFSIT